MSGTKAELNLSATAHELFDGLHGRASTIVDLLGGPEGGTPYRLGVDLSMTWGCSIDEESYRNKRGDGCHINASISAEGGGWGRRLPLVRVGWHKPSGTSIKRPDVLSATRGHEIGGDYAMYDHNDGLIEFKLGAFGFWRTGAKVAEPYGTTGAGKNIPLERLNGEDLERVQLVVGGITDALTAVEWVQGGMSGPDAATALGREFPR